MKVTNRKMNTTIHKLNEWINAMNESTFFLLVLYFLAAYFILFMILANSSSASSIIAVSNLQQPNVTITTVTTYAQCPLLFTYGQFVGAMKLLIDADNRVLYTTCSKEQNYNDVTKTHTLLHDFLIIMML